MAKKIIATVAAMLVLLVLSSVHYLTAYSQMNTPGSQNLPSFFKNLLGPEKQVSGHYSNPQFGIADIVFPYGWSGREMPPILGLSVIMHPGTENQSSSLFGMSSIPFARPQMILQVLNNSDVAEFSSEIGNPQAFSISKVCKPLAQNTTSLIDGKIFNVATVECPLSSLTRAEQKGGSMPSMGSTNQSNFGASGLFKSFNLNPNAVMQAKFYEFKTPDKTYRLGLIVSNLFSSQTSEKPDIFKYTQLLDTTANTLKFR
ncbi:MAG TPA: hypothetical protein VE619_06385 [Nitrososphaeraceae archaeon]|nr:hypothetical protein [Nitrososphaeraceae archaeon]